jgi:hypothetical protein
MNATYSVVTAPFPPGLVANPLAEFCLVERTGLQVVALAQFVPSKCSVDKQTALSRFTEWARLFNADLSITEISKKVLIGFWRNHYCPD